MACELNPTELALITLWDAVYRLPEKTEVQFGIQEKVAPEVARIKRKIDHDKSKTISI